MYNWDPLLLSVSPFPWAKLRAFQSHKKNAGKWAREREEEVGWGERMMLALLQKIISFKKVGSFFSFPLPPSTPENIPLKSKLTPGDILWFSHPSQALISLFSISDNSDQKWYKAVITCTVVPQETLVFYSAKKVVGNVLKTKDPPVQFLRLTQTCHANTANLTALPQPTCIHPQS